MAAKAKGRNSSSLRENSRTDILVFSILSISSKISDNEFLLVARK